MCLIRSQYDFDFYRRVTRIKHWNDTLFMKHNNVFALNQFAFDENGKLITHGSWIHQDNRRGVVISFDQRTNKKLTGLNFQELADFTARQARPKTIIRWQYLIDDGLGFTLSMPSNCELLPSFEIIESTPFGRLKEIISDGTTREWSPNFIPQQHHV
jgi:hypothetical protein